MKKVTTKLLSLLIAILIVIPITFTGCDTDTAETTTAESTTTEATTEATSEETDDNESIPEGVAMWKVTSENSDATLYLMGSIHAAKPDTFPLRDEITNAFEESDYLAVEANTKEFEKDVSAQREFIQKCMYSDGSKIYDHISQETYEKAKAFLKEENQYYEVYDLYKPYMWSTYIENALISQSDIAFDQGVDTTLIEMAEEAGKEILEVESIDFQLDLLLGFSDELYDIMISESIDSKDDYAQEFNDLYDAWHSGNVEEYMEEEEELPEDITEEEEQLYEEYNKAMLTDRNIGMADKAEQYLAEGKNVFFVVGAAHMVGDDGIVQLLKDRGYTVKRV